MTDFAPIDNLEGRVAVVAGGTGAIGLATARRLAAIGARCVLLYARKPAAEAQALAAALPGAGHAALAADMLSSAALKAAATEVQDRFGAVHILVNSAGRTRAVPAADLDALGDALIDEMLAVNLRGVIATMRAFLPLLKASRGRIVNISSVAGRGALPFLGPYAASKFGLEAISDSLRRELLPFGVRVIVIEPGSFKTAIWGKVEAMDLRRYAGTPYERVLDRFRRAALRGAERAPPPDKVVRAVWRALTARRPPLRVLVTPHGWLDRIPLWIPDRWLDWLIHRFLWRRV